MSLATKSKDKETLFSVNADQATVISKIDDHIKSRFNLILLRFDSLPKLNTGSQNAIDKLIEEFSFFKIAYPQVLKVLLRYDPATGTKIESVQGLMFTGAHLRLALEALFERFRLTLLAKVPKRLHQNENLLNAAYEAVTNTRDFSITSKLLRKFKEVELELANCYNLAYILLVEQKLQEINCEARDSLDEYVRTLPDFKGQILQFNHSRKSEALSLYLSCHANHYATWMENDQKSSKLPTCEDIAREVSECPDYFRLVKIETTNHLLNLFVKVPDGNSNLKRKSKNKKKGQKQESQDSKEKDEKEKDKSE